MNVADYLREQQHTYITPEQAEAIAADIELLFPCVIGNVWSPPAEPVEKTYPWYSRWTKTMETRARNGVYGASHTLTTPKWAEPIAMMEEIRRFRER